MRLPRLQERGDVVPFMTCALRAPPRAVLRREALVCRGPHDAPSSHRILNRRIVHLRMPGHPLLRRAPGQVGAIEEYRALCRRC